MSMDFPTMMARCPRSQDAMTLPEVKKLRLAFSIRLPKDRLDEPRIGENTTLAS
jgi:hypothetical protein